MVSPSSATPPAGATPSGLAHARTRLAQIYHKEIWRSAWLKDRSPRGILYAILRVLSITITVISETRIASRAAALSFSSLLGLGPLIAIAVLIGGFMLGSNGDSNLVANKLGEIITTIAPQLRQLDTLNTGPHQPGEVVRPEIVKFVEGIITAARSGNSREACFCFPRGRRLSSRFRSSFAGSEFRLPK